MRASISNAEARRIALGAQGFTDARPTGRIDRRHLRRVLDRIGLLQIDSVNVLVRSQELPLFARLGPHPRTLIADAANDGELFEYWIHEASLMPVEQYHLFGWRMEEPRSTGWQKWLAKVGERYVDDVLRRVADEGPLIASDLDARVGKKSPWWDYDDGKMALELLFAQGRVAARRRTDFARLYDLPERIIPASALGRTAPPAHDAHKQLLLLAARHHGIGTVKDLADYHRLAIAPAKRALTELVEEGALVAVDVEGWQQPAYVVPGVRTPRRIHARALLSPFDPIVWHRERALRMFDFHYRIEIYTPKPKRTYGYYVLPFLLGDSIVGRVDLKADRANRDLLVQSAWIEPGADPDVVADALAEELASMATWLGLDDVVVGDRGDLAATLRRRAMSRSSTDSPLRE